MPKDQDEVQSALDEEVVEFPAGMKRPRSQEPAAEATSADGVAFGCAGGAIVLIILGVAGILMKTVAVPGPRGVIADRRSFANEAMQWLALFQPDAKKV